MSEQWPPADRAPTADELALGTAIENEDGSVSWSPLNSDFDGIDDYDDDEDGM